jgi:hypothetical protein
VDTAKFLPSFDPIKFLDLKVNEDDEEVVALWSKVS